MLHVIPFAIASEPIPNTANPTTNSNNIRFIKRLQPECAGRGIPKPIAGGSQSTKLKAQFYLPATTVSIAGMRRQAGGRADTPARPPEDRHSCLSTVGVVRGSRLATLFIVELWRVIDQRVWRGVGLGSQHPV